MTCLNRRLAFCAAFVLLGISTYPASADEALRYGPRVNRHEGVRAKPVSGFGVELLSAIVAVRDRPEDLGDYWRVRFFLPRRDDVHIVVRELDYKEYYWLDKVDPPRPWKQGYENVFSWPTADVVRPLGLRISDMGVVARLGQEEPGAVEKVAPAVFYQSRFPRNVSAYLFHFKVRETSQLNWAIYQMQGGTRVASGESWRQGGGRPFSVKWDVTSSSIQEGAYRLVLSGYVLSNNDRISQVVEFYHRPKIR
jgi:hypothetical protein